MNIYLICDNMDTYTGMRLVGVEGVVVHEKDALFEAVQKAKDDDNIGILLINESLCNQHRQYIDDIKLNCKRPLLVEIPDRHGTTRASDYITNYVKDAIGVKL